MILDLKCQIFNGLALSRITELLMNGKSLHSFCSLSGGPRRITVLRNVCNRKNFELKQISTRIQGNLNLSTHLLIKLIKLKFSFFDLMLELYSSLRLLFPCLSIESKVPGKMSVLSNNFLKQNSC